MVYVWSLHHIMVFSLTRNLNFLLGNPKKSWGITLGVTLQWTSIPSGRGGGEYNFSICEP